MPARPSSSRSRRVAPLPQDASQSTAAVTPASWAKAGVPSSNRSGTSSVLGSSLSGCSDSSSAGSATVAPTCGPYHLYAEQAYASAPSAATSVVP